jgi:hypothetical protein
MDDELRRLYQRKRAAGVPAMRALEGAKLVAARKVGEPTRPAFGERQDRRRRRREARRKYTALIAAVVLCVLAWLEISRRRHLDAAAVAFRTRGRGGRLPQSISGLWKADLFLGRADVDDGLVRA